VIQSGLSGLVIQAGLPDYFIQAGLPEIAKKSFKNLDQTLLASGISSKNKRS